MVAARRVLLVSLVMVPCLLFGADEPVIVVNAGASPTSVELSDVPNDDGSGVDVRWVPSNAQGFTIIGYEIMMSKQPTGPFESVGSARPNETSVRVTAGERFRIRADSALYVKVVALDSTVLAIADTSRTDTVVYRNVRWPRRSESAVQGPFQTRLSWFNWGRLNILLLIAFFFGLVLYLVKKSKAGGELKFRRLAGIDAIDEAIGRATELGKPVLYIPGTQNIENIQTIASIQLLTSVAGKCASYDTPIVVPLNRAFMVGVAEEAVKQGYMNAGRPDAYQRDNIRYLSDEQFAFTSGVAGIMMREKTAAHLYLGAFFAESLILSETGFSTGAIQIAGTANVHQLPFFVVACDYTLIGEEYFAASALVTKNHDMLGTVKATDWVKLTIIGALLVAMIIELWGIHYLSNWFTVN